MKVDHCSYNIDATFAVVKRKQRSGFESRTSLNFFSFRLSFHNCTSIIASITAMIYFHIILQPAVHILWFLYIHVQLTSIKNTLIQSLFLCCKIYTCACTWSIKLSDYLSFNLVAFFSASLYGSNTNSARPIFKQSNIPLYQLGYL